MLNKKIIILLILAVVIIISYVVLWYVEKQENSIVENNNEEIVNNREETKPGENKNSDEIDISDWVTYRNEEYGYQINYPRDWRVGFPSPLGESKEGQMIRITGDQYRQYYAPLEIFIHDGEGKKFEDWHTAIYSHPTDLDKLKESKRIIHNNTEFVVFNDEFGPRYYAIKNDKFVSLTTMDDFVDEEKGRKMMETMVFSFKFID